MLHNSDHRIMSATDYEDMNTTVSSLAILPRVTAYEFPAKITRPVLINLWNFYSSAEMQSQV